MEKDEDVIMLDAEPEPEPEPEAEFELEPHAEEDPMQGVEQEQQPEPVVIPKKIPGQKHNIPRTMGYKGRWVGIPRATKTPLIEQLDAAPNILKFENVRIAKLVYPTSFQTIRHTCMFDGITGDNVTYRFRAEDPRTNPSTDALHPLQAQRLFGTTSSRMPGFDPTLRYTLWCIERPAKENDTRNPDMYVIIHATYVVNKQLISTGGAGGEAGEKMIEALKVAKRGSIQEAKLLDQFGALLKSDHAVRMVLSQRPIFRILRCALAFYLWPQADLLTMRWSAFVKLADALENGRCPLSSFCFQWMLPEGAIDLGALDTMDLRTLHLLLDCNPEDEQVRLEQLAVEFFQRSFDRSKKDGHTFSSLAHLTSLYIAAVRQAHANLTVNTLLGAPESTVLRLEPLLAAFKQRNLAQYAHSLGIVHINGELVDQGDGSPPRLEPCLYAGDDWIKQTTFVEFSKMVIHRRFRRAIHADGCRTVEEVYAKIAKPPRNSNDPDMPPGAPRWANPNFQREWAKLDPGQRSAVAKAVINAWSIICGRPGTGKTQVFRTLFHLFGGREPGGVVPTAAYGRIASMLRERLDKWGHTFHHAAAVCTYRKKSAEAQVLAQNRAWLWDEGGLITHHHSCLASSTMGGFTVRMVIAGDPNQMSAIGSGSIFDSVVSVLKDEEGQPRYSELNVPWRFLTKGKDGKPNSDPNTRPDVHDDMTTDWNMRVVLNMVMRPNTTRLDLVFSENLADRAARFIAIPSRGSLAWVERSLRAVLSDRVGLGMGSALEFAHMSIQLVSQRHSDCRAINRRVHEILYGVTMPHKSPDPPIRIGERVTFSINGYFVEDDQQTAATAPSKAMVTDARLERMALASATSAGSTTADPADYLALVPSNISDPLATARHNKHKQKHPTRDEKHRGIDSDDVFNGEIKTVLRIVDVDRATGNVVQEFDNIKAARYIPGVGQNNRKAQRAFGAKVARLLIFKDDTQLNITDHYEADKVLRAYCISSKRLQGSEADIVINHITPADHHDAPYRTVASTVYREELYTNMTRARRQFICVLPTNEQGEDMLPILREVCENRTPPRRNAFARHINFANDN